MSAGSVDRALAQLTRAGAVLAPQKEGGGFAVFPGGDRRRRPLARLSAAQVAALYSAGAVVSTGVDAYAASEAGVARAKRVAAPEGQGFLAQHAALATRSVVDRTGQLQEVRAVAASGVLQRLAALRTATGAPWLDAMELRAAAVLRADWEAGQAGLTRGSDWSAPPLGSAARAASSAQEFRLAARCDARRRVADALHGLAAPLRRAVERICLHEDGIEALERAENWPARSGKLALKLALAQLAASGL